MNRRFYLLAAGLAALYLCSLQSALAIEIVVPDQYKEQVEAAKSAERAERARQLEGVEQAESGAVEIADQDAPEAATEASAPGSEDFVMQSVVEAENTAAAFEGTLAADEGLVSGQVLDQESGAPVAGAAIIIEGTDVATVTAEDGRYSLGPVTAGQYTISFVKTGYIEANVTDYAIAGGEVSVFPFALPPRPSEMSDEVYELQDFSVTAEQANELMLALDLRMSSDSIMNVMTSEDFSRFAASDVGDAIKRVAGITVEGGQFAVIRGLDERYSSTTLNGAPVPSPDPDRQSVPLDLFPSEIVSNLTVSKTFTPDLPGNSAGGSINIITSVFPEELEFSFSAGTGFNDRAQERFLERQGPSARTISFEDIPRSQQIASDTTNAGLIAGDGDADLERSFELKAGGTLRWLDRDLRFLVNASTDADFDTLQGEEESRFARAQRGGIFIPGRGGFPTRFQGTGDLTKGEVPGSNGRFDLTESEKTERDTLLLATEIDIDTEGEHRVGLTYFRNQEDKEIASLRENGNLPGLDATTSPGDFQQLSPFTSDLLNELGSSLGWGFNEQVERFLELRLHESNVLEQTRELEVFQVNGSHQPTNFLEGLDVSWAVSQAAAQQNDNDVISVQAFEDPSTGRFFTAQAQGVDFLQPSFAWREVVEEQDFYRADAEYVIEVGENITFTPSVGISQQKTERDTKQFFQQLNLETFGNVLGSPPVFSFEDAARTGIPNPARADGVTAFEPLAVAEGTLDVDARYLSGKFTLFEKFDIFGGVRFEKVLMTTGTNAEDGADFFNSQLLRQRQDGSLPNPAQTNTQILGINGGQPLPSNFEGKIDENKALPSLGLAYRPTERWRLSAAYSETLVRPSFKEFTFTTNQNPTTLDFESGNPALETSTVESFDFRAEYTWGKGDLLALSLFYKTVENPIEKTTLSGTVQTDLFFNNENEAELKGVEFEFRKVVDFTPWEALNYFSLGGNFAYIDASVGIPENFQRLLSGGLPVNLNGTDVTIGGGALAEQTGPGRFDGRFNPAPKERVLFQQPEWIANFDVSFDQPDWGTRVTLSLFAQSEALENAGGFLAGERAVPDEFRKAFHEVNLTLSQRLNDHFTLSAGVKNLTDSERGSEFGESVGRVETRSFKIGRSYSISINGSF